MKKKYISKTLISNKYIKNIQFKQKLRKPIIHVLNMTFLMLLINDDFCSKVLSRYVYYHRI